MLQKLLLIFLKQHISLWMISRDWFLKFTWDGSRKGMKMEKFLLIRVSCVLLMVCSFFISSVSIAQVKKYFPDFEEFPDASLLNEMNEPGKSIYRLPLGTLKRKEGSLHPEYEKKLKAEVRHLTYEIPRDYSPSEVFRHYLNFFIEQKKYQSLYACESRACGSNSHWANVIFSQRVLNGIVDTQRYVAMRAPSSSHVDYIALYFVQRGNKQNYIHLDLIDVEGEPESEKKELFSLSSAGFVAINGLIFSSAGELNVERSQAALNELLQWLRKNSQLHFALVAHTAPRSDIDLALKQSKHAADTLLAYVKMQKSGLDPELLAYGVGPLAPRSPEQGGGAYWVE
jgi:hypothetical protein